MLLPFRKMNFTNRELGRDLKADNGTHSRKDLGTNPPNRFGVRAKLACTAIALAISACSSSSSGTSVSGTIPASGKGFVMPSFYTPPNPLPPGPNGTLIRDELLSGVQGVGNGKIYRILYKSTSIAGKSIAVSGYAAVPLSSAPKGGYPIVSWAHGTTGVADICAPSLMEKGPFTGAPYLAPYLEQYMSAGYLVAATDYEGLGTPGVHPYLVGESEGRGVLDAALAARQLPGVVASRNLVVVGHSQGGQAALFAGEIAPQYEPSLNLLGVAAAAPATQLKTLLPVILTDKGLESLSVSAAYAWAVTYPNLSMAEMFTPSGEKEAQVVSQVCSDQVGKDFASIDPKTVFNPNAATDPNVIQDASLNDAGSVPTKAPILLLQGTSDSTIPQPLSDAYNQQACTSDHDVVDYKLYKGARHSTVMDVAQNDVLNWVADRFAGVKAPSTC